MNKNLLLGLALSAGMIGVSQNTNQPIAKKQKMGATSVIDQHQAAPSAFPMANKSAESAATRVMIGSSYNVYSVLVSRSTALTYNPNINTLMFTHRQNNGFAGGSGIIQSTFSKDGGATWDDYVLYTEEAFLCRYPSGVLYNPTGNTEPDFAYAAVFGPITSGAGWNGNFFASAQLDGTDIDANYLINDDPGTEFMHMARITAVSTQDGKVRVMADTLDWNATADGFSEYTAVMNTGTFNDANKNFDWEKTYFTTDFHNAPGDNTISGGTSTYQAWSLDGTIGYVVQLGVQEGATGNERTFLPIVYKSTDSGATWTLQPTMDWTSIGVINNFTYATSQLPQGRPFFSSGQGFDLTVDANNELHIACEVASQFTDNDDSLGYTVVTPSIYLYDVHTVGGSWDAFLIDSVQTDTYTDSYDLTHDCRLQMSRSADGQRLFYSWLATNPDFSDVNEVPDLYASGFNVETGLVTPAVNFTEGTSYDGDNWYMYLSDMVITNSTTHTLPITVSIPTGTDLEPIEHYYYNDITFDDSDFTLTAPNGLKENIINELGNIIMYPNPADNNVSLNMSELNASSAVVSIYNMLGQNIYQTAANTSNVLNIDISNLNAGIYVVEINVDGKRSTTKLTVK